ncbi:TIGR02678 family protein [Variovorax humicola]|uniref:TIGR02678 family protein n=1 Tax=Variovorax humicola TaxID=1769758 RepID=A0ABU8W0S9_9BURK
MVTRRNTGSQRIGELQARQQRDEFRIGLRALLMQPLMPPAHEDFPAVRRQADKLREWFAREAGWVLHVEREGARLYKRPADLQGATRGLKDFDRRRYVLLCLACAVLERADPQITLHLLGERVMEMATDPALLTRQFSFTLRTAAERRDLVAVCRSLLEFGVLQRVAGDEDGFVHDTTGSTQSDALYDIQRRMLAGMLAAVRGPSTWATADAPVTLDERMHALVTEHVADSDEGRRTALRHTLARRLLDDPVVYADALDAETQAYFANQRGVMAARLCDATGLVAEQRAEGLALTDEAGTLTDVAMPGEGTEAHVTLLVAEHLAERARKEGAGATNTDDAIAAFVRGATERYGRFWRKSAREPGAERELAQTALERLQKLDLIRRDADRVYALPAIARFALGDAEVQATAPRSRQSSGSLF